MSSSNPSGLGRTRSLRRPAGLSTTTGSNPGTTNGSGSTGASTAAQAAGVGAGSASPSRLPMKHPTHRSGLSTSSIAATTGAGPGVGAASARSATRALASATASGTGPAPASGRTRSTTTTGTGTSAPGASGTTGASARGLGRAPSTRYPPLSNSATIAASGTTTTTAATGTTTRPRSATGTSSKTASGGAGRAGMGHARAKSTVTTLTSATTLRPAAAAAGPGPTTASRTGPSASRTTTTGRGHHASASRDLGRATTGSAQSTSASSAPGGAAASSSSMPPPPLPSSTTASAAQQQQQQRPAFNTNQQHYSPLKSHAPKPLTATFLAPPSPSKLPANVAISAETSRLQTELLQLSLMHRDAAAVSAEWSASARSKLGARFEDVARESRQLTQLEQREAEGHNIAALLRWCDADADADADGERLGGQAMALEDKIQTLDQVLGGIWSLSGGEQYARLTREFEDWAEQVADILAAQRKGAAEDLLDDSDEVLFVSELDTSGWKSDCPGLVRKLQSWRRMLRDLGRVPLLSAAASPADASLGTREENGRPAAATAARPQRGAGEPSKQHSRTQSQHHARQQSQSQQQQPEQRQQQTLSSLERILADCETLVNDMLAELTLMEAIERDALQAENDWILRVNRDLRGSGSGSHYHGDEGAVGSAYDVIATPSATGRDAVPLWKMVL